MKRGAATDGAYVLFDLRIGRSHSKYRMQASVSPSGGASEVLKLPSAVAQVSGHAGDRKGRSNRDVRPPQIELPKDKKAFGEALYRAVFTGRIGRLFGESVARLAPGQTLRLRLHLDDVPELSRIAWEYLRDPDRGRFLAQTSHISIVRYLGALDPGRPLPSAPPLEVVVVIAQPKDRPKLAASEEWEHIRAALGGKSFSRRAHLEVLANATFEALAERIHRGPCHVLHFLGHGSFDLEAQTGMLLFEDGHGNGVPIDAGRFSALLSESEVRLVVLNTCRGAEHSEDDAFSGVAQDLVRKGMPAVIAMQSDITDEAAVRFARKFYRQIADGKPIDFGLAQARRDLYFHGDDVEWGTPALYTCAPDGHLFNVAPRDWGERLKEAMARPAVLAAAGLIGGAIAVGLPSQKVPTPSGPPLASAIPLVPASPQCPAPPGTDIRFRLIPKGTFTMGSNRKGEKPSHRVTITKPFCLGQSEVTRRQWTQVMSGSANPRQQPSDELPITGVSWDQAHQFVARLNETTERPRFRLPTEAEWEYAARAGSVTPYSFGDDFSKLTRYGNCGNGRAAPVHQLQPNPWDLYDMHGNVWEWVEDWYGAYSDASAVDPKGPAEGEERVRRGGGFESSADNCRSAARKAARPFKQMRNVGFRIVEDLN